MIKTGSLIQNGFVDVKPAFEQIRDYRINGRPQGLSTGWKSFDPYYRIPKEGQLSVVTGVPGSGKSEWLDSLAVNMVLENQWQVFVYSPENYPIRRHIEKISEKLTGNPMYGRWNNRKNISDNELMMCEEIIKNNFHFVKATKAIISIESILNAIDMVGAEFGCNMVIIDPWNKVDRRRPKNVSALEFLGECLVDLQLYSRENEMQTYIVAHPTKPRKDKNGQWLPVTLYDISGGAYWYDMVDNGFSIHRSWDDKTQATYKALVTALKIKDRDFGKPGECNFDFQPWCGRYDANV